jgi:hypothetical protein
MAKLFIRRAEGGAFLVHVDEDLAERPSSYSPVRRIDLVAADNRLLGVALAAIGSFSRSRREISITRSTMLFDDFSARACGARWACRPAVVPIVLVVLSGDQLELSGCESFEPSR